MIYIILLIWLLISSLTYRRWTVEQQINYSLICLVMAVVAGGRGLDVGVDTRTYLSIFNDIAKIGPLPYMETGWNCLNQLCIILGLQFNGLLLITSFLTLIPIFYVSKKLSVNPLFSIFIYYCINIYCGSLNVMRQYCAISFIFYSYYLFVEKKYIATGIAVIIAALFHTSSMIVVPILFVINRIKMPKLTTIGIIMAVSYGIGLVAQDSFYSRFMVGYEGYLNEGLYRDASVMATVFAGLMGAFDFWLICTLHKDNRQNFWCKLFAISTIVLLLTFRLELGARIYVIFSISQVIFLPNLLKETRKRYQQVIPVAVYLYLITIFLRVYILNANNILPYTNVWIN